MYATISTFSNTFDEIWLIYIIPTNLIDILKIGQIVNIEIRNNKNIWVVLSMSKNINTNFDISKLKSIISIQNENIFLSNYRIKLLKWLAVKYISPIHNALNLFFPRNLKEKIKNKKIDIVSKNNYKYDYAYNNILSLNQEESYNKIVKSENNKILLYWLTWSWKTEIYIKLIKNYLDIDKQVLFLIPEIILTNQLSEKIKKIFWDNILIINSTITEATKTKYWIDINNNKAKIIIWTRSALFYPYNNLWLIIIDEEHDNSYISDSSPRYNSIEVAEKITELNWNKLLLASGTPSIKSMYKWVKKNIKLVNLLEVYNNKAV